MPPGQRRRRAARRDDTSTHHWFASTRITSAMRSPGAAGSVEWLPPASRPGFGQAVFRASYAATACGVMHGVKPNSPGSQRWRPKREHE